MSTTTTTSSLRMKIAKWLILWVCKNKTTAAQRIKLRGMIAELVDLLLDIRAELDRAAISEHRNDKKND